MVISSFVYIVIIFILVYSPSLPIGNHPLTHAQVIVLWVLGIALPWLIKTGHPPYGYLVQFKKEINSELLGRESTLLQRLLGSHGA